MLQYMRWENNQQGMADSISILPSKRAESLVRNFNQNQNKEMEADPLWIWQTLLKISANSSLINFIELSWSTKNIFGWKK